MGYMGSVLNAGLNTAEWAERSTTTQSSPMTQAVNAHYVSGSGDSVNWTPCTWQLENSTSVSAVSIISKTVIIHKYGYTRSLRYDAIKIVSNRHTNPVGRHRRLQYLLRHIYKALPAALLVTLICSPSSAIITLSAIYLEIQEKKSLQQHLLKCILFSWQYCCYAR